jgi:hypothetical protein
VTLTLIMDFEQLAQEAFIHGGCIAFDNLTEWMLKGKSMSEILNEGYQSKRMIVCFNNLECFWKFVKGKECIINASTNSLQFKQKENGKKLVVFCVTYMKSILMFPIYITQSSNMEHSIEIEGADESWYTDRNIWNDYKHCGMYDPCVEKYLYTTCSFELVKNGDQPIHISQHLSRIDQNRARFVKTWNITLMIKEFIRGVPFPSLSNYATWAEVRDKRVIFTIPRGEKTLKGTGFDEDGNAYQIYFGHVSISIVMDGVRINYTKESY